MLTAGLQRLRGSQPKSGDRVLAALMSSITWWWPHAWARSVCGAGLENMLPATRSHTLPGGEEACREANTTTVAVMKSPIEWYMARLCKTKTGKAGLP